VIDHEYMKKIIDRQLKTVKYGIFRSIRNGFV